MWEVWILMQYHDRLFSLTKQLIHYNNEAFKQYTEITRHSDEAADFYKIVKPFVDKVNKCADEWKDLVLVWIKESKPKYIHPINIESTFENLMISSVQAFQKDTRQRRFNEMIQSIDYILNHIIDELEKTI